MTDSPNATIARAFEPYSDDDLDTMMKTADTRAKSLAAAVDAVDAATLPTDLADIKEARAVLDAHRADAIASRDLIARERSRRKQLAIAAAVANPKQFPKVHVKFMHGRTPPGWKTADVMRLVDYDKRRGYVEVLRDGDWFMAGDVHHVEDLDGKYI